MCGIAGLVTWRDEAAGSRLGQMTASLVHRGPDDGGTVSSDGVHLGHRRLTIIDLSANGRQPMSNEDNSVWITYNGELYGTGVLRARLESRGHQFRSRTDTEILIHLYEDEGTGLFRHVNGMFAFAIHDRGRKRLLLARDRLGVKPLFYAFRGGELLFGSELKAVFTGLGGKPPLRADVLGQYILQGYASSPDTLFEGVWSLPPGHYLDVHLAELEAGRLPEPVEYWDAPFTGDNLLPAGEAEEELGDLLGDAVRIRMVADVPVGAFLSGGIDSGAVVALMSRVSDRPVRTFTVDLPGTAQSEGAKALAVSRKYGTEHVVVDCTSEGADEYWPLLRHYDAPFNCASLLNAWLISRATRQHVTVALSGDGGDELFGGYTRYLHLAGGQPGLARQGLARAVGAMLPHDLRGRARVVEHARDPFTHAFTARHPVPVETAGELVGTSLKPWASRMRSIYERYRADHLTRAMYLDLKSYLADHVLAKVDSASMAVSLEVRVPFLDYRVVEFAGRLPASLKIKGGGGKWLLRRLARRLLPEGLVEQKKVGFDPPLSSWAFADDIGPRLQELAQKDALFRRVLDPGIVDRWVANLRKPSAWRVPQRAGLWSIYQLERWLQMQESQPAGWGQNLITRV